MKRRYYSDDNDFLWRFISVVVLLYFFYLIGNYFANRAKFWQAFIYGVLFLVIILSGSIGWNRWRRNKEMQRVHGIIEEIRNAGLEDYIKNFINRFGFEGRRGRGWSFRNHVFEWDRIDDLERYFLEKNINLRADEKKRDIFTILRLYIQEIEEKLTRESIKREPQKFATLTGTEFEKLIYRLFTAMGYSVQWIGKSGDQGGDLIANREGARILIQAKCYRDWSTGNEAVQQVAGAMKYYDCGKAMVITTSYFTSAAITLAKANGVELISKDRLQGMLLEHLKESWS